MTETVGEVIEPNCPFCNVKAFEERLIAEVDGFYIVATLGQIPRNGGYVLLIPKEHVSCIGALPVDQAVLKNDLVTEIALALYDEYSSTFLYLESLQVAYFEHGIVGQTVKHAHLHLLPTALNLTSRIREDFPQSVIQRVESPEFLQEEYQKKKLPYLHWSDGFGGAEFVCWDPPAPPQYLRIISAEDVGYPERANWRTMDPDLDRRLWSDTVRRLKPYFK